MVRILTKFVVEVIIIHLRGSENRLISQWIVSSNEIVALRRKAFLPRYKGILRLFTRGNGQMLKMNIRPVDRSLHPVCPDREWNDRYDEADSHCLPQGGDARVFGKAVPAPRIVETPVRRLPEPKVATLVHLLEADVLNVGDVVP
ncbi:MULTISPECIES: hypothetical protein [Rhizobium/Agrobacterium group]|jgi:hypothetical protein|uniref:hypothetical protein n=1 Tax=Rhizobium/Agrobacterium group TaxID=227290 RepID=UPI000715A59D|nr:hypothetical protein [Rhizobium sp. Leaf262]KQO76185.1 hypothetical protein ASF29_09330 [Rhizobium sp. Leaf262]